MGQRRRLLRSAVGARTVILREYQLQMVEAIRSAWASGVRRVLGVLPTGGGKTEVAIQLIMLNATPLNRVLVVVERKVLCQQWRARLHRHGVAHVGIVQGENTIGLSATVLVATVQSLRTRGVPEDVHLIVIDESHIWHESHNDLLLKLDGARVLGLTATPVCAGLGQCFDTMVIGATIKELIRLGHLVQPRYFAPNAGEIERALARVAIRAGDYVVNELSAAMRGKAIMGDVVGTWQRRAEGRQTIAFCVDKAHAHDLAAQFVAVGIETRVVLDDTDDVERFGIFQAFDRGDVKVLCSVGVLAIGFDSPVAACAILARPTCSLGLYVQQGGRVLRPFSGKVDALVLDHAGNTLQHGLLEDFISPTELSVEDRRSGKKKRRQRAELWVCQNCEAINDRSSSECAECGEPRVHHAEVVVIDGELRTVEQGRDESLHEPAQREIKTFYAMALWHAQKKGLKSGWAYHATRRRFRLEEQQARMLLPPPWDQPIPLGPDDAAARWFHADFLRSQIAYKKGKKHRSTA